MQAPFMQDWITFNENVIESAMKQVNVTFVGPEGKKTLLERRALQMKDLRFRPQVLAYIQDMPSACATCGPDAQHVVNTWSPYMQQMSGMSNTWRYGWCAGALQWHGLAPAAGGSCGSNTAASD